MSIRDNPQRLQPCLALAQHGWLSSLTLSGQHHRKVSSMFLSHIGNLTLLYSLTSFSLLETGYCAILKRGIRLFLLLFVVLKLNVTFLLLLRNLFVVFSLFSLRGVAYTGASTHLLTSDHCYTSLSLYGNFSRRRSIFSVHV